MAFQPLEAYGTRTLTLFASLVAGQSVTIVLSKRIRRPAVVAYRGWTILLDPDVAGLLDLCLAARLLGHRAEAREHLGQGARAPSGWVRACVREALTGLRQEYPGIDALPGAFRPSARATWPELVWQDVRWRPLGPGAGQEWSGTQMAAFPTFEVTGAGNDFRHLLRALREGRIATQRLPELPELEFVHVPFAIPVGGDRGPRYEEHERVAKRNRQYVAALRRCYIRKARSRNPRPFDELPRPVGVTLDDSRLAEVAAARQAGYPPAVFRRRRTEYEPIFDPKDHCLILGFDLNGLHPGRRSDDGIGGHALLLFLETYRTLGVDLIVLGFAGRLLQLPGGRQVYLHSVCKLKDFGEKPDGTLDNRFAFAIEHRLRLPGTPCTFHPLLLHTVEEEFRQVARVRQHGYRSIFLAARGGMPDSSRFQGDAFLSRVAAACDGRFKRMQRSYRGILDAIFMLPDDLRARGVRGGLVANGGA